MLILFIGLMWDFRLVEHAIISIERFGVSAPGGVAMEKFGYTVDNVVARAKAVIGK